MKAYDIAVVSGDGIGPEVCAATIRVIEASLVGECTISFADVPAGAGNYLDTGVALPDSTIERCRVADAILLGAAGLPGVLYEDGTEAGQDTTLRLRFELDLYANLRPIKLYDGVPTPLHGRPVIDYVIVRENSEGLRLPWRWECPAWRGCLRHDAHDPEGRHADREAGCRALHEPQWCACRWQEAGHIDILLNLTR